MESDAGTDFRVVGQEGVRPHAEMLHRLPIDAAAITNGSVMDFVREQQAAQKTEERVD